MRAKLINEVPERTFALILDTGDEVVSTLERFAADNGLVASRFTATSRSRTTSTTRRAAWR